MDFLFNLVDVNDLGPGVSEGDPRRMFDWAREALIRSGRSAPPLGTMRYLTWGRASVISVAWGFRLGQAVMR